MTIKKVAFKAFNYNGYKKVAFKAFNYNDHK